MSSDKAQYAALGAHLAQRQTIGVTYRAEGRRLAVAEVVCVAIGGQVYTAEQLAEMAALWDLMMPVDVPPLSEAELAEEDARMAARREVVRAAIRWRTTRVITNANDLDAAVDAFLAAGGDEVVG